MHEPVSTILSKVMKMDLEDHIVDNLTKYFTACQHNFVCKMLHMLDHSHVKNRDGVLLKNATQNYNLDIV